MAAAAKLLIDIAADIAKLRTDFNQAGQVLEGFGRGVEKVGQTFRTAMGALGVGLSIGGIKALVDSVGDLGEAAERVGLDVETFQALSGALRDAGLSAEQTGQLLSKGSRFLGDALDGNRENIERLKALGVGLLDAKGNALEYTDVLPQLARSILAIEDPMRRTAAITAVFGKAGAQALPALEAMARGTEELKRQYAGEVIPAETIRRFDEFSDKLKGLSVQTVAALAVEIDSLFPPETIDTFKRAGEAWDEFFNRIRNAANSGEMFGNLNKFIASTAREIEALGDVLNKAAQFVGLGGPRDPGETGGAPEVLPPIRVTGGLPTPRGGGGGSQPVDKFAEAMKRLREETEQTEVAIRAFERASGLPTKEAERLAKLASDVGSKTSQMLKGVSDAGQQEQVKAAVQALENLKFSLDELKVTQQTADEVSRTFGDGQKELADRVYYLDKALAAGKITAEEYAAALDAARQVADQQLVASEGLAGGIDSVSAGFRLAAGQMTQAQADMQLGADLYNATLDTMSSAIVEFVETGQLNFGKLAQSFAAMLLEMTARWAAASLLRAAFGGLGGLFGGGAPIGNIPAGVSGGAGIARAWGGDVMPGRVYDVGEFGREKFIPHAAGRIEPAGGGGVTVNIVNNAPANVQASEGRGANGAMRLDVLIEPLETAMAGRMARGQGALGKVIEGTYGATRRGRN